MKTLRLAAALALPLLFAAPALAEDPVPSAKDYPAPPAGWTVPRTAWGDPDLRGMWPVDYLQGTPRDRAPDLGTRTEWTEEEYQARQAQADQGANLIVQQDKVGILGMGHWTERGHPLWQTSLIVQPAARLPEIAVVSGARLAVSAPWLVLLLLCFQSEVIARYASAAGVVVLAVGGALCLVAYRLMVRIGRLPQERRVLS